MASENLKAAFAPVAKQEVRREYYRQWRAKNPDKVKSYQERYWAKKGREYMQNIENSCNTDNAEG